MTELRIIETAAMMSNVAILVANLPALGVVESRDISLSATYGQSTASRRFNRNHDGILTSVLFYAFFCIVK
jgi:hypothetical protein